MLLPDPDQDPDKAARLREKVIAAISPRQLTYAQLVCHPEEYTSKRISEIMKVSEDTVKRYQRAFLIKFSVRSKPGLVLFALLWRLLEVESRPEQGPEEPDPC